MKQKFPVHPLIFALYPVLVVLLNTANQRHLAEPLRSGALMALGGAALYGLLWLLLRRWANAPLRAALLASLVILFFYAYDPLYELVRGRALMGLVYGKHRYLLPAWLALAAASAGWLLLKLRRGKELNSIFTTGSLAMLALSIVVIAVTGSWLTPLRDLGLASPPGVQVSYINVGDLGPGQPGVVGDAVLLRSTEGKNVLIDAGYPNGLAAAYLKKLGVTHLDMVVISHPDDDHAGGLIEILKTVPVDLLVSNGETLPDSVIYAELEQTIRASGVKTQVVRTGDELPFGYLTFQVLSPSWMSPDSVNHNSIIMRLPVGKVSFMFTGDADNLAQMYLLERGANVQTTIYKIAHHGADGNTYAEFIRKVNPDVAIYIAGAGNAYGFPEANTLKIFEDAKIPVYGTDSNGSIVVKTDGNTYEVIPEREGQQ